MLFVQWWLRLPALLSMAGQARPLYVLARIEVLRYPWGTALHMSMSNYTHSKFLITHSTSLFHRLTTKSVLNMILLLWQHNFGPHWLPSYMEKPLRLTLYGKPIGPSLCSRKSTGMPMSVPSADYHDTANTAPLSWFTAWSTRIVKMPFIMASPSSAPFVTRRRKPCSMYSLVLILQHNSRGNKV